MRVVQLPGHFFEQAVEIAVGGHPGNAGTIAFAQSFPVDSVEGGIIIALVHHLPDLVKELQTLLGRERLGMTGPTEDRQGQDQQNREQLGQRLRKF